MKKLLTLIFCFVTLTSFSQKTKILKKTPAYEITTSHIKCDKSYYEAITITNLTSDTITLSFSVESYWSNNPAKATTGDELYDFIIEPNKSVSGNCNTKLLYHWSSGPQTDIRLTNLTIINLIFGKK